MTILITGAYGFVGTNLSNHLQKQGYTLWALDIKKKDNKNYSRYFSWDDIDSLPTNDIDAIIHLAGIAHDTKNRTEEKKYFEINTGLTKKIYDKFAVSDTSKFIFFSSVKAAADHVEKETILTEDVIPSPKGPYGESKIAAENHILNHKPENKNKKIYIFRPCMIHGPGNKGNLNMLYNAVRKGIPYPLGAFDNLRSFTSVSNLCYIIELLLNKQAESGIYNISDDKPVSTNDIIKLISKTLNKPCRIWNWNPKFIHFCAIIGSILHLPLNTERLQKLTENYIVSNKKIKCALGIEEMPTDAKTGLKQTIESFIKK